MNNFKDIKRDKNIIKLYLKGNSIAIIGEKYNRSGWWVKNILKNNKVKLRKPGGGLYLVDLSGKKFGHYTVIRRVENDLHGNTRWVVRCDCGHVREISKGNLTSGRAKSCGKCKFRRKGRIGRTKRYKGVEDLSMQYWKAVQIGAKRRNLIFDLDIQYGWDLYLKQNKKCALSGLNIFFCPNYSESNGAQTASLDRIDSSKGYVKGNVRWLHKSINISKWHFNDEYYYKLCNFVVKYNKNKYLHKKYFSL